MQVLDTFKHYSDCFKHFDMIGNLLTDISCVKCISSKFLSHFKISVSDLGKYLLGRSCDRCELVKHAYLHSLYVKL